MLKKIKSWFVTDTDIDDKKVDLSDKCLVDIKISKVEHTFFLDADFVKRLREAVKNVPDDGFFEYQTQHGGYVINLRHVSHIQIRQDIHDIDGTDPVDCCSVYLSGKKRRLKLGRIDLSLDQIRSALSSNFVRLGDHFFKSDDLTLIVLDNRASA